MLKLIYGRAGTNLGDTLFSRIDESVRKTGRDDAITHLLIVPRHYSHESERALCAACGDSISRHCEVLTTDRLAVRVFSEYGGIAEIRGENDDAVGKLLMMSLAARRIAPELRTYAPYISNADFLQSLLKLWDEFSGNRTDIAALPSEFLDGDGDLSKKLHDITLLFSQYQFERELRGLPRDLLDKLADTLAQCGYLKGKHVFIYGYTELTGQEYAIVNRFLQYCEEITVALECDLQSTCGEYEDLFFAQRRTAENLRRMCAEHGRRYDEEQVERASRKAPDIRFLERHLFTYTPSQYERSQDKTPALSLHMEQSVWDECERAASEILRLVREMGYKYRDFAVALSDYAAYSGPCRAVFEAWGIPAFFDRMDSVAANPVIAAINAVTRMISGRFTSRDVLSYIKSGLSPLHFDEACALENYIYIWNISGRLWTDNANWELNPRGFSAEFEQGTEEELARLNELRRTVYTPFAAFFSRTDPRKRQSASALVMSFYTLLCELKMDEIIENRRAECEAAGDLRLRDVYAQMWQLICDILDSVYSTLDDTEISFAEFASFLDVSINSANVGTIPVVLDGVPVGEPGRLRHRKVKVLLLLGAESGRFPAPAPVPGLLSDPNRKELLSYGLSLDPPSDKLIYRETDLAYSAMTLADDKLYISWSAAPGGAAKQPSFICKRAGELLGVELSPPLADSDRIYALSPVTELALSSLDARGGGTADVKLAAFKYISDNEELRHVTDMAARFAVNSDRPISGDAVSALYGSPYMLTPSRADRFNSCHFAYFMQYGLRVSARRKATLDALESGNLLHSVLEGTVKEVVEQGGFSVVSNDVARDIAYRLLDEYANNTLGGIANKSPRIRYLFGRIRRSVGSILDNICEEMRVSAFVPMEFELRFGRDGELAPIVVSEDGKEAAIEGVVDRLDGWVSGDKLYIRVVDYKSGVKSFSLTDIWHGLGLQMLVYLFALEERGRERYDIETVGSGVLYAPVKEAVYSGDRGLSDAELHKKTSDMLKRSGLVLDYPEIVEAMEPGHEKRFVPVSMNRDGNYSALASVASLSRFGALKRHVDEQLRQIIRLITSGDIGFSPYRKGSQTACDFCDYKASCGFDETLSRNKYRYLYKVDKKDFWARLEGTEETAEE